MRIYISVDMEGVAGSVHSDQTSRSRKDYEKARHLMTEEANAAIKGALDAGAKEIIVNDSHGTMRNIEADQLMEEANLISGSPKKLGMMEGIDETFDAALFIGYHTKRDAEGTLNHSYNGRVGAKLKINGEAFGEFGMNALVAGEFDVPVVFVSGCNLLKEEAVSHLPAILVGEVKRTVNQDASESLHPKRSREIIRESVKQALLTYGSTPAYRLSSKEYRFELEFSHTIYADIANTLPIVQKKNPVTVEFVADNILDGYYIVRSLIMMADSHESSI